MRFSYYPGCTLKTKAKELDGFARRSAQALGIELKELDTWQCCGGVYPLARDEVATKLASVRALSAAADEGGKLVTLCSACHHVLKRVNDDMKNDPVIRDKVNAYIAPDKPYSGETEVIHFLELFRDVVGFEELKKKVTNPLTGVKIGAYYSCMLLRPGKVMQFDDPGDPSIMEDLIRALGAEPVEYPYRNECCGGYLTLDAKELAKKKSADVMKSAADSGASMLITACPLCMYNLKVNSGCELPVFYFTQLLARALGVEGGEEDK